MNLVPYVFRNHDVEARVPSSVTCSRRTLHECSDLSHRNYVQEEICQTQVERGLRSVFSGRKHLHTPAATPEDIKDCVSLPERECLVQQGSLPKMATVQLNSTQIFQPPLKKLLISTMSSPFLSNLKATRIDAEVLTPYKSPYSLVSTYNIKSTTNQGPMIGTDNDETPLSFSA